MNRRCLLCTLYRRPHAKVCIPASSWCPQLAQLRHSAGRSAGIYKSQCQWSRAGVDPVTPTTVPAPDICGLQAATLSGRITPAWAAERSGLAASGEALPHTLLSSRV